MLPTIASYWTGSDLSFFEQVVIRSFQDAGHAVRLYVTGPVGGVPAGVEVREAEALCPAPFPISDGDRTRVAVYSDLLRLHILREGGAIWADLDAYCRRAFDFDGPHVYGRNGRGRVLTGVMGLPPESPTLAALLAFLETDNPLIPWRGDAYRAEAAAKLARGESWTIADLPWGVSGPKGFTHFLRRNDEIRHAKPKEVFYPLIREALALLWRPGADPALIEPEGCHSVHLFGSTRRVVATHFAGLPPEGSYLAEICRRHGVDPTAAPARLLPWMQPRKG
ncbi:hypothetical protein PSA7680_00505 [Pseudoruegeria aquimaris]|uniref:Glycosyltransferase sugar-binding region containing DXD motif protein n=1 Tax=Pseudoruegeria aquimaris TaxID=393663 RepID=A0A1Y5RGR2_9RHOB|nr:hypothetical protein [Pseudoruegeria aquimaris]SLN16824.1 hypothetical protein PSA7680_00505 [Pseudoruegeria aquimaris]